MTSQWIYTRLQHVSIEAALRTAAVAAPQTVHFHDEVQIVSVHRGWRSFLTVVGEYRAEAGDVVVIPAGMLHAPKMSECSAVTNLYVDPADPAARAIAMPFVVRRVRASGPADLLDVVSSRPRDGISEPRWSASHMRRIVADSGLSVAGIAQRLGLSTDGFIRAFRRAVGTTPARYRQLHRLCTARRLLRDGLKPADVAYAASFADQSHLGRVFLGAFGTTPAAYRSGLLQNRAVDFVPD